MQVHQTRLFTNLFYWKDLKTFSVSAIIWHMKNHSFLFRSRRFSLAFLLLFFLSIGGLGSWLLGLVGRKTGTKMGEEVDVENPIGSSLDIIKPFVFRESCVFSGTRVSSTIEKHQVNYQ